MNETLHPDNKLHHPPDSKADHRREANQRAINEALVPETEALKNKLENRKAVNKAEEDRLRAMHKADEDAIEARINPGKPLEPVIVGDVEYSGHNFVDGLPVKGVITVPQPGVTKQEVLRIAQAQARAPLSDEGFTFNVVDPKKEPKK